MLALTLTPYSKLTLTTHSHSHLLVPMPLYHRYYYTAVTTHHTDAAITVAMRGVCACALTLSY